MIDTIATVGSRIKGREEEKLRFIREPEVSTQQQHHSLEEYNRDNNESYKEKEQQKQEERQ